MARIERSIEIERSPERVFDAICDVKTIAQWATIAGDFEEVPDRPIAAGDTFRHTIRVSGVNLKTSWRVLELERPDHILYEVFPESGGWMKMRQSVIPTDRGSRVELEIDYELPGGFLGEALDRVYVEHRNEREAEASLHNLKYLVETSP